MTKPAVNPFRYFKSSPEVIRLVVMMYVRYPLSLQQEMGQWLNNRVENSHLSFRRRERAMLRFRQMRSLQKFASVHAHFHNHFALERHLVDREIYKQRRSAALAQWQSLAS